MLDSADALARLPLFAGMGRLDLAKIAGELDEVEFGPGDLIVHQGDEADALFVLRSGEVEVTTGDDLAAGGRPIRLGPGESFGEMALLAGSLRSATVAAATPVRVWRLPADRFLALLDRDRSVAREVERALSRRLATTTRDAVASRSDAAALARSAIRTLPPRAAGLLALLALRPRWTEGSATAVAGFLDRSADLAYLIGTASLVRREGGDLLVPAPIAVALPAEWRPASADLRRAAGHLRRIGDLPAAIDLFLAAEAVGEAATLLRTVAGDRDRADPDQIGVWIDRIRRLDPVAAAPFEPARTSAEADAAARQAAAYLAGAARVPFRLQSGGWIFSRLAGRRPLGAAVAIGLYTLAWLMPATGGLDRAALITLGALAAMVPLLVFDVLPDYVVSISFIAAVAIPGAVTPAQALAGFGTSSWLTILALFGVSAAVAQSGLLYRLALWSLEKLPANFIVQAIALIVTGVILSAAISNGSPRAVLAAPTARAIADAFRFAPRGKGAAAIGLVAFLAHARPTALFLTASTVALVLHGLMPAETQVQFSWGFWAVASAVPYVILGVLSYLTLLLIFRPPIRPPLDRAVVRVQRRLLGPPTRAELIGLTLLLLLIAGFASTRALHIDTVWVAAGAFIAAFATGVLDSDRFQRGINWGLMLYFGALLSLEGIFQRLRIDVWLADQMRSAVSGAVINPSVFILGLAIVAFLIHFVIPWSTASPLLALVAIPLAGSLGISPFIPVFVILLAGDHSFLPYVNPAYLTMFYATEGALFTHAQARPLLWCEAAFRILALLLSVPYWQMLGLA